MKKQLLRIVLVAGLFVGSPTASSYTIDQVSTPSVLTGLWWNAVSGYQYAPKSGGRKRSQAEGIHKTGCCQ